MADTTYIIIKEDCVSRKQPNQNAAVYANLKKGNQYVFIASATNNKGNLWYKLSSNQWVFSGHCNTRTQTNYVPASSTTTVSNTTAGEMLANASNLDADITLMVMNNTKKLESAIDGSTRLFGLPHQLTAKNDYRLSKRTKLGTMFTETFILDAPILYVKPGGSNFLPGMTETQKTNIITALVKSASGDSKASELSQALSNLNDEDWRYFEFQSKYEEFLYSVNMLCRVGSVFLDINDLSVPWESNSKVTYGVYDWSGYKFSSLFTSNAEVNSNVNPKKDFSSMIKNALSRLLDDEDYIRFYVDANTSFSESASNSTSQSMINSFTDQLETIGKELSFVSGMSGLSIDQAVNASTSTIDSAVSSIAKGDGAISTFLKRLTGVGKQVLAGANFLTPEIWGGSDYSKSYSFAVTLATPYGTKEAWFLNIYVPLMHLLTLALPKQVSANTYTAPFLVRVFAPGWFTCDLGIIDSISIDKGGSGDSWSSAGLPNEIKVQVSVKDLYANLALPSDNSIKTFFANTGLINYLMVNCGVDITKQSLEDKVQVMMNLFLNNLGDTVQETFYSKVESFRESVRNVFNLFT